MPPFIYFDTTSLKVIKIFKQKITQRNGKLNNKKTGKNSAINFMKNQKKKMFAVSCEILISLLNCLFASNNININNLTLLGGAVL